SQGAFDRRTTTAQTDLLAGLRTVHITATEVWQQQCLPGVVLAGSEVQQRRPPPAQATTLPPVRAKPLSWRHFLGGDLPTSRPSGRCPQHASVPTIGPTINRL